MPINVETAIIFITLVYIVVIELGGRTNDSPPERVIDIKEDPFLGLFPNLGLISIVHFLNTFILVTGYLVILTNWLTGDNVAITLVLFLTASMLYILPFVELDDYSTITGITDYRLSSLYIHSIFSTIFVFAIPLLFLLSNVVESPSFLGINISAFIFVGLFIIWLVLFLGRLRDEVTTYVVNDELENIRL